MSDSATPDRPAAELRKLVAEAVKLEAEARSVEAKLATELPKLDAEASKVRAEISRLDLEIAKLQVEQRRSAWLYALEWIKGAGTSAALVAAVVALLGFWNTVRTGQLQRHDELAKRIDAEFTAAAQSLVDGDDAKRTVGVLSLARYLGPGYGAYHERAAEILVVRLRMERDPGARGIITTALVRFGPRALPLLDPLRSKVQRELIPLYDRDPLPATQIDVLQHAFLQASQAIAGITSKPIDLSHGPLKGIRLQHYDLTGAILLETSLWNADFYRSVLVNARLQKAILRNAVLRRADLSGADLMEADLVCADLSGTDLRTARRLSLHRMKHSTWREALLASDTARELETLYPDPAGSKADRSANCRADGTVRGTQ